MEFLFICVYANQDLIFKLNKLSSNDGSLSIAAMKYTRLIGEGLKHNLGNNSTNLFFKLFYSLPVDFHICKIHVKRILIKTKNSRMLVWKKK